MTSNNRYDIIELLILEARHELIHVREEYFQELRTNLEYLSFMRTTDVMLKKLLEDYRVGRIEAAFIIPLLDGVIHMVERIRKELENLRKQSSSRSNKIVDPLLELLRRARRIFTHQG